MASIPTINAIFACLAGRHFYRDVIISEREVFVGPDCERVEVDGRVASIKTPNGAYDMAALVAGLPAEQRPDLVVVKADASGRNIPRNLAALRCPRVLLVGDTHHMGSPIRTVLRYALQEPYDLIIMDHTRQHSHFFIEAGFRNVNWIPCFDYALRERPMDVPRVEAAAFVGQSGRFHPYRRHVLTAAAAAAPLLVRGATPEEAANIYAAARISLNCSLNGDLNLRIFEVLGSGGFLLTDQLSRQSGLDLLFEPGRHLDTYRNADEAAEKIQHYLAHPEEAERIRRLGREELFARHHPDVKRRQLFDLVFSSRVDPVLDLAADRRCGPARSLGVADFQAEVALYERLQELHRTALSVTTFTDLGDDGGMVANSADLPRLTTRTLDEMIAGHAWPPRIAPAATDALAAEYVLRLPQNALPERIGYWLAAFMGRFAVVDPRGGNARRFAAVLNAWGFVLIDAEAGLFECRDLGSLLRQTLAAGDPARALRKLESAEPRLTAPQDLLAAADVRAACGQLDAARLLALRAVRIDRENGAALSALWRIAAAAGDQTTALAALLEKRRTVGLDGEEEARQADLLKTVRSAERLPSASVRSRRILIVTDLFPHSEAAVDASEDDAAIMWEYAEELRRRGYETTALASDEADAALVAGGGENWRPDACLIGSVNRLGSTVLDAILALGAPTLHCVYAEDPGYPAAQTPSSPLYRVAPASQMLADCLLRRGYTLRAPVVIRPGWSENRLPRAFLPSIDRLRIIFFGKIIPEKGPQLLINALNIIKSCGIAFECELFGEAADPNAPTAIHAYCERQGMADAVQCFGPISRNQLRRRFACSNIFVLPSLGPEPLNMALIEAMAAGLTVVSSVAAGKEIIRHGVDGLLFQDNDHQDLAAKLLQLTEKPAEWAALGLNARERALDFSVEHAVDQALAALEEIAAYANECKE